MQRSPNRDRLIRTASRLGALLPELVFVGGQTVELLLTEPATVRLRPTDDVDVIVSVTSRSAYGDLQDRLRALGFQPDMRQGAPICRVRTRDDLVLDVMPLDEAILGFSNRWYPHTIDSAEEVELEPGLRIRAATTAALLATKWEAFLARGGDDVLTSRDLEDIVTLVAGRPAIAVDVDAAPADVRDFIRERTRALLANPWLGELVLGSVPDARHIPSLRRQVIDRLRDLAGD